MLVLFNQQSQGASVIYICIYHYFLTFYWPNNVFMNEFFQRINHRLIKIKIIISCNPSCNCNWLSTGPKLVVKPFFYLLALVWICILLICHCKAVTEIACAQWKNHFKLWREHLLWVLLILHQWSIVLSEIWGLARDRFFFLNKIDKNQCKGDKDILIFSP